MYTYVVAVETENKGHPDIWWRGTKLQIASCPFDSWLLIIREHHLQSIHLRWVETQRKRDGKKGEDKSRHQSRVLKTVAYFSRCSVLTLKMSGVELDKRAKYLIRPDCSRWSEGSGRCPVRFPADDWISFSLATLSFLPCLELPAVNRKSKAANCSQRELQENLKVIYNFRC